MNWGPVGHKTKSGLGHQWIDPVELFPHRQAATGLCSLQEGAWRPRSVETTGTTFVIQGVRLEDNDTRSSWDPAEPPELQGFRYRDTCQPHQGVNGEDYHVRVSVSKHTAKLKLISVIYLFLILLNMASEHICWHTMCSLSFPRNPPVPRPPHLPLGRFLMSSFRALLSRWRGYRQV